jgi:hypothetical protein
MSNPIAKALSAAWVELSSEDAIYWYREKAWQWYLIVSTLAVLAWGLVEQGLFADNVDSVPLVVPAPSADPAPLVAASADPAPSAVVTTKRRGR